MPTHEVGLFSETEAMLLAVLVMWAKTQLKTELSKTKNKTRLTALVQDYPGEAVSERYNQSRFY